jgi:hypothetical protein
MKTARKFWDAEADALLQLNYRNRGARWCAEQLGRTILSVYQRANLIGLVRRQTFASDEQVSDAIREFHPQGFSDNEISQALAKRLNCEVNRHRVGDIRRSLGLGSNALSAHRRAKVAAKTQQQLAAAGVSTLGALRVKVWNEWKRKHGWPTTLTARAVQAAEIMFRHGQPMTRVELCVAMGVPPKDRTEPKSNAPGGTVLAELQRHGLVTRLQKAVKVPANLKVHTEPSVSRVRSNAVKYLDLYFLTGTKHDHIKSNNVAS